MSLRNFFKERPTAVFDFRYDREDGEFRVISVPSTRGRFVRADEEAAKELGERRLKEQYGEYWHDLPLAQQGGDDMFAAAKAKYGVGRVKMSDNGVIYHRRPDLDQSNYTFTSVTRR